jgi:hypothetical protein
MQPGFSATVSSEHRAFLPEGVKIIELGKDASINDKKISLVSFLSNGQIDDFMQSHTLAWEKLGVPPVSRISSRRAVSVAVDRGAAKRYSLMVWQLPPIARNAAHGYSLQGMLAIARIEGQSGISGKEVPGVPMMPGGTSGTVFSSEEYGGRSYTGSYINPGTIQDNVFFYRNELSGSGWRYSPTLNSNVRGSMNSLRLLEFSKGQEELTLIFSEVDNGQLGRKTLVTVVRAPRAPRTS